MRRRLHACLIGVLTLSLSMDAARACWFLTHGCQRTHAVVITCPPVVDSWPVVETCESAGGCEGVGPCGCFEVVSDVAIDETVAAESMGCDCDCGADVSVGSQVVVTVTAEAAPSEVVADRQPTLADVAPQTAEVQAAPLASAVPAHPPTDDVRQAVALAEPVNPAAEVVLPSEPAAAPQEPESIATPPMEEDVPDVEPAPVASAEAEPALEGNIFEEVDQAAAGQGSAPIEPAPAGEPPAVPDPVPGSEPADAVDPFDAAHRGPREPARRWIDRSGGYAVVGALRAVRDDGICVLETADRTIEVPVESLSQFDRAYVQAAAVRLASAVPESRDTVGL